MQNRKKHQGLSPQDKHSPENNRLGNRPGQNHTNGGHMDHQRFDSSLPGRLGQPEKRSNPVAGGTKPSPVEKTMGAEVLTESALRKHIWPVSDPQFVNQQVETFDHEHLRMVNDAARNYKFDRDLFESRTKRMTPPEKLFYHLSMRPFNFNSVEGVRRETFWVERIENAMERGEPIQIGYPLMCKVRNPAKQFATLTVSAGELATLFFFKSIGETIRDYYLPGIRINIASDAVLYNPAFQSPPPVAARYVDDLKKMADEYGVNDVVKIHDYVDLLKPHAKAYETAYERHYYELSRANSQMLSQAKKTSLFESVRASLNCVRFQPTYSELRESMSSAGRRNTMMDRELNIRAELALKDLLAIKMACDDIDVFQQMWPNHLRVSCHRGQKKGRHVIGLRPYPLYYGPSKLLPYHGMALFEPEKRHIATTNGVGVRSRMVVRPEMILRGDQSLTRVINIAGDTVMYKRN